MNKIQQQVEDWINSPGHTVQYFPKNEILAQIQEECGEVGREIAHLHGHKKKKEGEKTDGLESEIGDVFFALCCLANSKGIVLMELGEMAKLNLAPLVQDHFGVLNYIIKNLGRLAEVLDFPEEDLEEIKSIILRIMSNYCILADCHGIDPEKAFEKSMAKKTGRDKDRFKN